MGLLDWLTDSIGSAQGQDATGTGAMLQQQMPPTPPGGPPNPLANPAPPSTPSPPIVGAMGEAGDTTNSLGLAGSPSPGPPPVPDPSTTDIAGGIPPGATGRALAQAPPPMPPAATPISAQAPPAPPGAPMSLAPTAPGPTTPPPPPPASGPGGISIIGRALGLNRNTDKEARSSFGAGLSAIGKGAGLGQGKFAAFAGGMGNALEAGKKAQDTTIDQQSKALTEAIAAVKSGDERALNAAKTKLALAQADMTAQGKGGKDSVVNSDQQLYLRAQSATNQDLNLKAAKTVADRAAAEFGSDSPQAKAARDALKKASDEVLNGHLQSLGLDPKKAAKIGKMPGMTQDNPLPKEQMKSQQDFDKLPPGSWFTNPKDGAVLQKPLQQQPQPGGAVTPAPGTTTAGTPPPAGAAAAPPAAGTPPTPPVAPVRAAATAPEKDDDEDDT